MATPCAAGLFTRRGTHGCGCYAVLAAGVNFDTLNGAVRGFADNFTSRTGFTCTPLIWALDLALGCFANRLAGAVGGVDERLAGDIA